MSEGNLGTYLNPYSWDEYLNLLTSGQWTSGFVTNKNKTYLIAPGLEEPGTGTGTGSDEWPPHNPSDTGSGTGTNYVPNYNTEGDGSPEITGGTSDGGSAPNPTILYTGYGSITGSLASNDLIWNATGVLVCRARRLPGVGLLVETITYTVDFAAAETSQTLSDGTTILKSGNSFRLTGTLQSSGQAFNNSPIEITLIATTTTTHVVDGETVQETDTATENKLALIMCEIEVESINTRNHTMVLVPSSIGLFVSE